MLAYLLENWLGLTGLISGLLCVWLLIRENVLTFPIGLFYAVVTVVVMARNQLYADVLLNVYYVLMNAYGWYFWTYGLKEPAEAVRQKHPPRITWMPAPYRWPVAATILAGSGAMGWYFASYTDAALPYPDSFTTVTSFVAMWMSARKYLESWGLWLIVNILTVVLYLYKAADDSQLYLYAVLYGVYIVMAFQGWFSWRRRMLADAPASDGLASAERSP